MAAVCALGAAECPLGLTPSYCVGTNAVCSSGIQRAPCESRVGDEARARGAGPAPLRRAVTEARKRANAVH